jgi:hypothetical protein
VWVIAADVVTHVCHPPVLAVGTVPMSVPVWLPRRTSIAPAKAAALATRICTPLPPAPKSRRAKPMKSSVSVQPTSWPPPVSEHASSCTPLDTVALSASICASAERGAGVGVGRGVTVAVGVAVGATVPAHLNEPTAPAGSVYVKACPPQRTLKVCAVAAAMRTTSAFEPSGFRNATFSIEPAKVLDAMRRAPGTVTFEAEPSA